MSDAEGGAGRVHTMTSERNAPTAPAPAVAGAPAINRGRYRLFGSSTRDYSARTIRLVEESLVIDMLAPFGIQASSDWLQDPETFTAEDHEEYRGSGINVFHVGAGQGIPGELDPYLNSVAFIGRWNQLIAHHPDWFVRIASAEDLDKAHGTGRIGVLIGIQNSEHFRSVDDVGRLADLGLRVSQLTYNSRNHIGTGCMEDSDGGLSDFGVDVVRRMNQVGMVVDLGHCGDRTTMDAFEASSRPVLVTHANVRALVPGYRRNKTDEAIRRMAETGGVLGLTAVRSFVRDREPTTIEHLLDHYDYVARLVGVEHVGIGTDKTFEGYDALPEEERARLGGRYMEHYRWREKIDMDELRHPKRTFDLTEGLTRRGYSDDDIRLILGGNFKRALTQIWDGIPGLSPVEEDE
jgi:membrane dipeptidase